MKDSSLVWFKIPVDIKGSENFLVIESIAIESISLDKLVLKSFSDEGTYYSTFMKSGTKRLDRELFIKGHSNRYNKLGIWGELYENGKVKKIVYYMKYGFESLMIDLNRKSEFVFGSNKEWHNGLEVKKVRENITDYTGAEFRFQIGTFDNGSIRFLRYIRDETDLLHIIFTDDGRIKSKKWFDFESLSFRED